MSSRKKRFYWVGGPQRVELELQSRCGCIHSFAALVCVCSPLPWTPTWSLDSPPSWMHSTTRCAQSSEEKKALPRLYQAASWLPRPIYLHLDDQRARVIGGASGTRGAGAGRCPQISLPHYLWARMRWGGDHSGCQEVPSDGARGPMQSSEGVALGLPGLAGARASAPAPASYPPPLSPHRGQTSKRASLLLPCPCLHPPPPSRPLPSASLRSPPAPPPQAIAAPAAYCGSAACAPPAPSCGSAASRPRPTPTTFSNGWSTSRASGSQSRTGGRTLKPQKCATAASACSMARTPGGG